MRLITIFELATRSETELRVMFRMASEEAGQTSRAAEERANANQTLANIAMAIQYRKDSKP